jgi:membrane protein YqaA with SNARE-associated domain
MALSLFGMNRRLDRLLAKSAADARFFWICMVAALAGTMTAAYPVTAVVVPAVLLAPQRWRRIAAVTAVGSALGATLLVFALHNLGWNWVYERFPQLARDPTWIDVMDWAARYDALALFLIAASPLPQTPALIFFSIAGHDHLVVFVAMFCGKLLKYGLFAWLASRVSARDAIGRAEEPPRRGPA